MSILRILLLSMVGIGLFTGESIAQICNAFPYPLTNGATADASQVTADLTYAATCRNSAPIFSVYLSADQTISSSVFTKVSLNAKNYDVGSYFDATTNFRYTPLIAGKYLIIGQIYFGPGPASAGVTTLALYKNGSSVAATYHQTNGTIIQVSGIVTLNGSSDYIELWGLSVNTGSIFKAGSSLTFLQGYWLTP